VTNLTVIDRLGEIVAHVSTRKPFDVDTPHVIGAFVPGPAFAQLQAPLAEFQELFTKDFEKAALFHEKLDELGLGASDEAGRRYNVYNIQFQNNGLLFSVSPRSVAPLTCGVEIFVSSVDTPRLLSWLDASIGPLPPADPAGDAQVFKTRVGPLVVTPVANGNQFTSFWLNSPAAPWVSDVDFARAIVRGTTIIVRCDPGPNEPSDVFLEVGPAGEASLTWGETDRD
jgi:hypothetical protein